MNAAGDGSRAMCSLCPHGPVTNRRYFRAVGSKFGHLARARHYAWVRRTQLWIFAIAVTVIMGGATLIGLGMRTDSGGTGGGLLPSSLTFGDEPPPKVSPSPTGPSKEELAARERAKRVKALD